MYGTYKEFTHIIPVIYLYLGSHTQTCTSNSSTFNSAVAVLYQYWHKNRTTERVVTHLWRHCTSSQAKRSAIFRVLSSIAGESLAYKVLMDDPCRLHRGIK